MRSICWCWYNWCSLNTPLPTNLNNVKHTHGPITSKIIYRGAFFVKYHVDWRGDHVCFWLGAVYFLTGCCVFLDKVLCLSTKYWVYWQGIVSIDKVLFYWQGTVFLTRYLYWQDSVMSHSITSLCVRDQLLSLKEYLLSLNGSVCFSVTCIALGF